MFFASEYAVANYTLMNIGKTCKLLSMDRCLSQYPTAPESSDQALKNDFQTAISALDGWITQRLTAQDNRWLQASIDDLLTDYSDKQLYIALGRIPRVIGRHDFNLSAQEIEQADSLRPGWYPARWTLAGAARTVLLAKLSHADRHRMDDIYPSLCRTADYNELIDLYSSLSVISPSEKLTTQAADGLRTNTRAVFESIAHHNPYPAENFDEQRWNHMVLKALFIDSTLGPIIGLDSRRNKNLADMLYDYAKERRAAGRTVSAELWRCVGPFATGELLSELTRVLRSDNNNEQMAAALAVSESPDQHASEILSSAPEIAESISSGKLQWQFDKDLPVLNETTIQAGCQS